MAQQKLSERPVHLGLGASAETEPLFTGDMAWYGAYADRHKADGAEGRLVSMHTFSKDWDVWEMHPMGAEMVLCVAGAMTLIQELSDGTTQPIKLEAGDYALNPAGVWHTADISNEAQAVFITAGMGTEHRPRD